MRITLTAVQKRIVGQIRGLYRQGKPLNISAVRESHPRLLLEVYRIKPFWGWKQALEAAGLDYSKIKVRLSEYVACRICDRMMKLLGIHIRRVHGMSVKDYVSAYPGTELWSPAHDAQARRGGNPIIPHWEPNWTPEYVLDRLYELHRQDVSLRPDDIKHREFATYSRANRYFTYWDRVLAAIGVESKGICHMASSKEWTKAHIIKAIAKRHTDGHPVHWAAMNRHDKTLTAVACRLFHGYDNALRASGFDPRNIRRNPKPQHRYKTRDDVLNAIIQRRLREKPLHHLGVSKGEHRDVPLRCRAQWLFGSWREAVEASGFKYDRKSRKPSRCNTADEVLSEIRRRYDAGLPLTSVAIRKGSDGDNWLYTQSYKFFRHWSAAVQASGIDYESLHKPRSRYPTKESVMAEIKRRHRTGLALNVHDILHGKAKDMALYLRAILFFGNWSIAVEQSGAPTDGMKKPGGKYPTKEAVLAAIVQRRATGISLAPIHLVKGGYKDHPLLDKARQFFGNWRTAVTSANIDYGTVLRQRRRYMSREAVIAELRRRQQSGIPTSVQGICRGPHKDSALYYWARREIGPWSSVVKAAGLDCADDPRICASL